MNRSSCAAIVLLTALAMPGCDGDPGPVATEEHSVPVSGVVTYKGKPLAQHRVVFMPVDGRRPGMGVTNAAGRFALGTNVAEDGVPPGKSKVAVVWAAPEPPDDPALQVAIDDPRLMPKPDVVIPGKYNNPETSGLTADIPEDGTSGLIFQLED